MSVNESAYDVKPETSTATESVLDPSFWAQLLSEIHSMDRNATDNGVFNVPPPPQPPTLQQQQQVVPETVTPKRKRNSNASRQRKRVVKNDTSNTISTTSTVGSNLGNTDLNTSTVASSMVPNGWSVIPASDAPAITWIDQDSNYQYTVQNPDNQGDYLVKLQVMEKGIAKHASGIFVNSNTDVFQIAMQLSALIENQWVYRQTGEVKIEGLTKTAMPLTRWRANIINSCKGSNPTYTT